MTGESTRLLILDKIKENPGIHFRELQRVVSCATGQLQYHLYRMETSGDIYSRKDGRTVRYFPSSGPSFRDREIIYSLRSRERSRIIFLLLDRRTLPVEKILKVRKSRLQECREALDDLLKAGVVKESDGNVSLSSPEEIISVLKKYKESFIDSLTANLISLLQ
ncbi:MAG: hypothetical protein M1616_05575 [Candidatus Thermoplasmatota archaeon]|nr:hypothetical protein [Candidatus Thermoplasmatota archaeon]